MVCLKNIEDIHLVFIQRHLLMLNHIERELTLILTTYNIILKERGQPKFDFT